MMIINKKSYPGIFLFVLITLSSSANAETGRTFNVTGTATANDSTLKPENRIKEGDRIETGTNSSAKVVMEDGTVLDIRPNTSLVIEKYRYNRNAPEQSNSTFNLVKGAFRYISGQIAKVKSDNVTITTRDATIGIRGSFDTISFDGVTVSVDVSIGTAIITYTDGSTVNISVGQTGTLNITTGQSSVIPTPVPDAVVVAAQAIAQNPEDADNVETALQELSSADQALVMAALINNAEHLGVPDPDTLAAALGNAVLANPANAVVLVYIASALSPDNSQLFIDAASQAAPDQADDLQNAGEQGTNLAPPPSPTIPAPTTPTAPGATSGDQSGSGAGGGGGGDSGAVLQAIIDQQTSPN